MAAATKKKRKDGAYPWKAGASSAHITNLKQSILETFDIYGSNCDKHSRYLYLQGKAKLISKFGNKNYDTLV
jgi:hypothetical protein